jgi:hypothetical protein
VESEILANLALGFITSPVHRDVVGGFSNKNSFQGEFPMARGNGLSALLLPRNAYPEAVPQADMGPRRGRSRRRRDTTNNFGTHGPMAARLPVTTAT